MSFAWLKTYMPRSLYGRAALILLVPVLTIQVVVSIVFIQRLYEGVTEQMTGGVLLEVRLLEDAANAAPDAEAARAALIPLASALAMTVTLPAADPGRDSRAFYDLSGRVVQKELRAAMPGLISVSLPTGRSIVDLVIDTAHGPMQVEFRRSRVSASNPHQLLVLMALISFLMTVIAFFFLRNQLRPVKQMAAAAEAFGKGQSVPYRPSGAIEMRQAGLAFLEMRSRIERLIEQRTLFLSGVSHDIRTPLTRLRLGLSMLDGAEDKAELIRDVDEMQRMLDEFLGFVRGAGPDDPEPVDPAELFARLLANADRAGQRIEAGVADCVPGDEVMLRPMAVERAVGNLLSNAVRYGRRVRLSLHCSERSVRFSVEDDGPGIAPARREEALRPFTRLDQARSQNSGGNVGLGLSIASDIARQHGGMLRLGKSDDLGGLKADLILAR